MDAIVRENHGACFGAGEQTKTRGQSRCSHFGPDGELAAKSSCPSSVAVGIRALSLGRNDEMLFLAMDDERGVKKIP